MHDHAHAHGPKDYGRAFAIGVGLNIAFVVIEAVYGLASGSLALLADAGHNLSDVLGLLLAWGAICLARRAPSRRRTYGFRRTTILAALANSVILMIAVGGIAWEALQRFARPAAVESGVIVLVAGIGIVVNTVTALLFLSGRKSDLNIRGAFIHMAADAGVSAGVVIAGLAIGATGLAWIDPVVGLIIVVVIAVGTWDLLRDSLNLALDAVPRGIDPDAVEAYLLGLPGVTAVHDMHIWGMSTTETALTAHLVKPEHEGDDELLGRICLGLAERFGINHATLQWERGDGSEPCRFEPDHVL